MHAFALDEGVVCAEDSDEDENGDDPYRDGVGGTKEGRGLSYLALSLEVEEGLVSMWPEVRVQVI